MGELKKKFVYKAGGRKGRKGEEKLRLPLSLKHHIKCRYEENDGTDAVDLLEEVLPELNEQRKKQKLRPVAVPREPDAEENYDPEGDPLHPDDGGVVPEGHDPVSKSYYDKSKDSSIWRIQNNFEEILCDPKHKKHKEAKKLADESGLSEHLSNVKEGEELEEAEATEE